MTSWLPQGLKDEFDDENFKAESDSIIERVKSRLSGAADAAQQQATQATEAATAGFAELGRQFASVWDDPEPEQPAIQAPAAATGAPAAMPTAPQPTVQGVPATVTIQDGRTTPPYRSGGIDNNSQVPQRGDLRAYTRAKAASLGIDPDVAERVFGEGEGGFDDPVRQSDVVYQGRREESYGPAQLNMTGGLGTALLRDRGIDVRKPENVYLGIDYALENAARDGWGAFHGAARIGIGNRQGIGQAPTTSSAVLSSGRQVSAAPGPAATTGSPGANPSTTQEVVQAAGRFARNQGEVGKELGLPWERTVEICGPVAAAAFLRRNGRFPGKEEAEAMRVAREKGYWLPGRGMGGTATEEQLLNDLGVATRKVEGSPDWSAVAADVKRGNPVIIDAGDHYMVAEGYDDKTGEFDFGETAGFLRAAKGRTKFRPDELPSLSGPGMRISPTAAIYLDNPETPQPSVVAGRTKPVVDDAASLLARPDSTEVPQRTAQPQQTGPQRIEQTERAPDPPQAAQQMQKRPLESLASSYAAALNGDEIPIDPAEGGPRIPARYETTTEGPSQPVQGPQAPEISQDEVEEAARQESRRQQAEDTAAAPPGSPYGAQGAAMEPRADRFDTDEPTVTDRVIEAGRNAAGMLVDPDRPRRIVEEAASRLGMRWEPRKRPPLQAPESEVVPDLDRGTALRNARDRGFSNAQASLIDAGAEASRMLGMPSAADAFEEWADNVITSQAPSTRRRRTKDALDGPFGLAESMVESAPSILPTVLGAVLAAGGVLTGNPALIGAGTATARAGLAAGGLSAFGSQARDLRPEVAAGRMSQGMANAVAIGAGLVEVATEKLFPGVDKKLYQGMGADVAQRMLADLRAKGLVSAGKALVREGAQEGVEEAVAESYGVAVDATFKEKAPTLSEAARRIGAAAVTGAATGAALTGGMQAVEAVGDRQARRRLEEDVKGGARALGEEAASQLMGMTPGPKVVQSGDGGMFGGGQEQAGPKLEIMQNPAGRGWLVARTEQGKPPEVVSRHANANDAQERLLAERKRSTFKPIEREAGDGGRDLEPDDLLGGYARQDAEAVKRGQQSQAQAGMFDDAADKVDEPKAAASKYEYSSTQLNLPSKLRRQVLEHALTIRDEDLHEKGRETDPHVTVKYGLETEDADEVRAALSDVGPIRVSLGKTSVFPASETGGDFDVVKADVTSPELKAINARLSKLPNGDKHPEYKPHVTLAYVKAGKGKKYAGSRKLADKTVSIDRLVFSSKSGEQVEIPLAGGSSSTTSASDRSDVRPDANLPSRDKWAHPIDSKKVGDKLVINPSGTNNGDVQVTLIGEQDGQPLVRLPNGREERVFSTRLFDREPRAKVQTPQVGWEGVTPGGSTRAESDTDVVNRVMTEASFPEELDAKTTADLWGSEQLLSNHLALRKSQGAKAPELEDIQEALDNVKAARRKKNADKNARADEAYPNRVKEREEAKEGRKEARQLGPSDFTPSEKLPEPARRHDGEIFPPKLPGVDGGSDLQQWYGGGWQAGYRGEPWNPRTTKLGLARNYGQGYVDGEAYRQLEADRKARRAERQEATKGDPRMQSARAQKLREIADRLEPQIQAKLNPGIANQNVTARRSRIAEGMFNQGLALQKTQTVLRGMADAIEDGSLPEVLAGVSTRLQVEHLMNAHTRWDGPYVSKARVDDLLKSTEKGKAAQAARKIVERLIARGKLLDNDEYRIRLRNDEEIEAVKLLAKGLPTHQREWVAGGVFDYERMAKADITTEKQFNAAKDAIKEYAKPPSAEQVKAKKIRDLERAQVGNKDGDFFPTPKSLAERMVREAEIEPGMTVLEPSAGTGNIAEAIREGAPDAKLTVVEWSGSRRELLEAKGFELAPETDFLKHQGSYDRILMNPPFSKNQDVEHVRHAYRLLKPGGRVIAIMSTHSSFSEDAPSRDFRAWTEKNGAEVEKLPAGTFNQAGLLNTTGVNAQLVTISKPATTNESVERTLGMLPGTAGTEGRVAPNEQQDNWRREAGDKVLRRQADGAADAIRQALAENREARVRWDDPQDRGRLHLLSRGAEVRVREHDGRGRYAVEVRNHQSGKWREISDRSIAEWNSGQLKRGVGAGAQTSVGGPSGDVRESAPQETSAPQTLTDEQRIEQLEQLLSEYSFAEGDAARMRAELAELRGEPADEDRAEVARQEREIAKRPPHSGYLAEDEDTDDEPETIGRPLEGPTGKQVAARGSTPDKRFRFRYRLANLDDLITSHDDALRENPAYPQSLQPRDRSREEYRLDREEKAKKLSTDELLTERGLTEHGPPIVGNDSLVESGNGRVLVLRHARANYPENYVAYQNALRDKLGDYGFDARDLRGLADPVLVRERMTPMTTEERASYTQDANKSGVMEQDTSEKARAEAAIITDEMLAQLDVSPTETVDTALRADKNREFIQKFLAGLESNEAGGLLTNTRLNEKGLIRIKQALFVRVFGPETALPLLDEFNDALSKDRMVALENGLYGALADIARVEGLTSTGQREPDLAIAADLAEAIRHQREIKNDPNRSVVDFAAAEMPLDGVERGGPSAFVRALTLWVDENIRRSKRIRETIKAYAQLVEEQPDPAQQAFFFDRPTKGELFDAASRRAGSEVGVDDETAPAGEPGGAGPAPEPKPADRPEADRAPARGRPAGEQSLAQILTLRGDSVAPHDETLIPEALKAHLSDHQKRGVALGLKALTTEGGFLLADGTGVGKTRQLLAIAKTKADEGKGVLIVAPNQVLAVDKLGRVTGSFAADATTLGVPFRLVMPKDGETVTLKPGEIAMTSYERLANKNASPRFETGLGDVVLFDEAHKIKGWDSATGKAGRAMADGAEGVVYATATPTDRPTEITYLSRAGIFEGKGQTEGLGALGLRQNKTTGEWYVNGALVGRIVSEDGKRRRLDPTEEVQKRIEELFERLTAKGQMIAREISMDGVEVTFDRKPLGDAGNAIMDRIARAWRQKRGGRMAEMQIIMQQRRQQEPFKVDRIVKLVQQDLAEGRRAVVFIEGVNDTTAQIKTRRYINDEDYIEDVEVLAETEGVSKLLKRALTQAGITDVAEIHGGAQEGKDEGASRFQTGTARVVVATIKSGGTGINLDDRVGDAPRTAYLVTLPWSAVEAVQAMGRVWRLTTKSYPKVVVVATDSQSDAHAIGLIQDKLAVLGATVKGAISGRMKQAAAGEAPQPFTPTPDNAAAQPSAPSAAPVDKGQPLDVHGGEVFAGDRVIYKTNAGKLKPSVVLQVKKGRAFISYEASGYEMWADADKLAVSEDAFGQPVGLAQETPEPQLIQEPPPSTEDLPTTPPEVRPEVPAAPAERTAAPTAPNTQPIAPNPAPIRPNPTPSPSSEDTPPIPNRLAEDSDVGPPAPPSGPPAPPSQPDLPEMPEGPERGPQQHVVGFGYFTGLDEPGQLERLQQIADDLAEYSRSGGVRRSEILNTALAAVDNDPALLEELVRDALTNDTKKRAKDGTTLRVAALRAFYSVEQAQKDADRLAASNDPGDREKLPAAIAALEAAKTTMVLAKASRRRLEAAARELNAAQAVFTARAARRQADRLEGVAGRVRELVDRLARSKQADPTDEDREMLRRLIQLLEEQGAVFDGSDPTLRTIVEQVDNLMGRQGITDESPEASPEQARQNVERSEKLADDIEQAAPELGEKPSKRKKAAQAGTQKLARKLVDLHNQHERLKPGAQKDAVRGERLAVITDLVDAIEDEVAAQTPAEIKDIGEEIRKRAARGVARIIRDEVRGPKIDKDGIAEAASRLSAEVISGLRRDGMLAPSEPTVMELGEQVVRLNRDITKMKRGDYPTVEAFQDAIRDLEETRGEVLAEMKAKIEERVRERLSKEKKPADQQAVDRHLARGMVGRISKQIDEQLRFPKLWQGKLTEQMDREISRALQRETINGLIERLKRLSDVQRKTWRAEGGEEAISDVLREIMALGAAQAARGSKIRRALHKANVLRYAGREMDDQNYEELAVKLAKLQNADGSYDPKAVADLLRTIRTPGALAYIHEYTTAGMLTSPMTWGPSGINMTSNVANVGGEIYAATPLLRLHDILTRGGTVTAGEPAALRRGAARARKEAARRAGKLWIKGHLDSEVQRSFDSGDLQSTRVEWLSTLPGPMGWFFQGLHMMSTRPLAAGDVLLGHILWEGKVEQLATRKANQIIKEKGALVVPAPTQKRPAATRKIKDRDEAARYIVEHRWDYPDILEEAGRIEDELLLRTEIPDQGWERPIAGLSRMRTPRSDATFVDKAMGAGAHILFPFVRVAHNLLKQSISVSPVGIPYHGYKYMTGPREEQGKHALKVLTGVALMILAASLVDADLLTAGGPDDEKERKIWLRTHQPYSIKINGTWYALQGMWLAMPLLMTAAMIEGAKEGYGDSQRTLGAKWADGVAGGLGGLVKGGVNAVLSQSYMQSANELVEVLRGRRKAGSFMANAAGRFVPASSMLRFLARIGDEFEREPDGFTEYMAAATPDAAFLSPWGTRSSVPFKLDEFGHPVKNQQQGGAALIPFRPRTPEHADDPMYLELSRRGVTFPNPPSAVDGVPINRQERIAFQMKAGPTAERELRQKIRESSYRMLSPAEKTKELERTITQIRTKTAKEMKARFTERQQQQRKQQTQGRRAA